MLKTTINALIESKALKLGAPILNATVNGVLANITSNNTQFKVPFQWNYNVSDKSYVTTYVSPKDLIVSNTTVIKPVVINKTIDTDTLVMIILLVIFGVVILFCIVGFLLYRRNKKRM